MILDVVPGAPTVTHMLSQLGVLTRAAALIDLDDVTRPTRSASVASAGATSPKNRKVVDCRWPCRGAGEKHAEPESARVSVVCVRVRKAAR